MMFSQITGLEHKTRGRLTPPDHLLLPPHHADPRRSGGHEHVASGFLKLDAIDVRVLDNAYVRGADLVHRRVSSSPGLYPTRCQWHLSPPL